MQGEMLSYKLKSWGIWKVRTRTVGLLGVWASFLEEVGKFPGRGGPELGLEESRDGTLHGDPGFG